MSATRYWLLDKRHLLTFEPDHDGPAVEYQITVITEADHLEALRDVQSHLLDEFVEALRKHFPWTNTWKQTYPFEEPISVIAAEIERLRVEKGYTESEVHAAIETHRGPLEEKIKALEGGAMHDHLIALLQDRDALQARCVAYENMIGKQLCTQHNLHPPCPLCNQTDRAGEASDGSKAD